MIEFLAMVVFVIGVVLWLPYIMKTKKWGTFCTDGA